MRKKSLESLREKALLELHGLRERLPVCRVSSTLGYSPRSIRRWMAGGPMSEEACRKILLANKGGSRRSAPKGFEKAIKCHRLAAEGYDPRPLLLRAAAEWAAGFERRGFPVDLRIGTAGPALLLVAGLLELRLSADRSGIHYTAARAGTGEGFEGPADMDAVVFCLEFVRALAGRAGREEQKARAFHANMAKAMQGI